MKNKGQKNERTTRVKSLILLVAFTAIMLIVSTYAWFSTQNSVAITNISGDVRVAEGLEISLDATTWSNSVDISKLTDANVAYAGNTNHKPTILKPASTTGATDEDGKAVVFYAGDLTETVKLGNIKECIETETTDTKTEYAGYYAFDVFIRNSSASTSDQQLAIGKASSAVVKESGGDDTTGLQNTVRMAFAEFSGTAGVNAGQTDILAATNGTTSTISQVAIWEPNSNYHVPHILSSQSKYGMTGVTMAFNTKMTTYAVKATTAIDNVWATDNTTSLAAQVTNQTEVTFYTGDDASTEDVVETVNDVKSYETAEVKDLTDIASTAFSIAPNKVTKLRLYVWIEGQDHDCIDYASHGGGVTINLNLEKKIDA